MRTALGFDLLCTPRDDPTFTNFLPIFTILTNDFDIAAKLVIEPGLNIKVDDPEDFDFTFNIDGIADSHIGPISQTFIRLFALAYGFIQEQIVAYLVRPFLKTLVIPLGDIIDNIYPLNLINLD